MRIIAAIASVAVLSVGCGHKLGYRHFAGPIMPAAESGQAEEFNVGDDRSITFVKDRLEVSLQPLTAEMLNRQFSSHSASPPGFFRDNPYQAPVNPYTYGDWKPAGEEQPRDRFSVFLLKVKNYAYPKVRVDPATMEITAPNGRRYHTLDLTALTEYYWPYAVAYAGNTYRSFKERESLMRKTLFRDDMIFSGQEKEGFVVFPALDHDVEDFEVRIDKMALRFDYRNEPLETVDIPYQFTREVSYAQERPAKRQ